MRDAPPGAQRAGRRDKRHQAADHHTGIFLTIRDLGRISSDPEWYSLGKFFVDNAPLDMLVCYAGLSGMFTSSDGLGDPPSRESAAFIVFDAHTGNQFGYGLGAPLG